MSPLRLVRSEGLERAYTIAKRLNGVTIEPHDADPFCTSCGDQGCEDCEER